MATLGDTSEPTSSAEAWSGATWNMHGHVLTLPSGGPWKITKAAVWAAGYGSNTSAKVVVWSGSGGATALGYSPAFTLTARTFSASGSDLYDKAVYADGASTDVIVAGGSVLIVGFMRADSGGAFFGKRSTGSHRDKDGASSPGSPPTDMASNTTDSSGAMGAYITYELANSVPNAPTLTSPASGATITDTTPQLQFTHNDPDSDAVVSYDLQVDTATGNGVEPDWASLAFESVSATTDDDGAIGGDTSLKKSTSALTPGSWYAWRARTNDGTGDGAWSVTRWFFLNSPPTVGTRTPGASGFAYIHNLAETALWTAVSAAAKPRLQFVYNDADGHASASYRVRIYKAPSGGAAAFDSGVVAQVVSAGATITADVNYAMPNADGPETCTNIIQNGSSTDANNYVTASVTMKAGRLYLLSVENSKGSASADAVSSVTGGGGVPTFTSRGTTLYNTNLNRVTILSAVPTTDYTGTLTINFGGVTQTGAVWSLDEIQGVDTTTTDGVVQNAVGTGNSGTALATLAAFVSSSNPTFGAGGHAAATASAPGTGFTEKADQTQATPAQALATEYRTDSDTSVDMTFTSAQWGMVALELQSNERWWTVEVVDSAGDTSGESSRTAFKVRYGQGRYAFNPGSSSNWGFSAAAVAGGTQSAFLFRSSTDGNGGSASAWFTSISAVPIQAWVEVIARLATYTVGTNPALADMTFTYLGTATTPDRWTATPTAEWALVTDIRRFGARAIKCTVVAGTAGNRYIVPFRKVAGDDIQVSKNTKYTFSAFVKTEGALTGGNLRLAVSRTGSDTDFITPDVASPIVTNTSAFPDGWQRITMTFTTEAIETVRPMLLYTRNSGVNEAFYTDAWKIEEGTVATAWTPGFIGTPVVLDANGIQVDGSAGGILRLRGILGGARDTVELGQNGLLIGGDVEVFSDLANELRLGAGDSLYVPSEVRLGSTKDVAWTRGAANRMDLAAGDTLRLQTDGNGLDFVNGRIRGAGTSFPGSPATDDLYYRTDRDMWYGYDGTRWLSQEYQVQMMATVAFPIAATSLVGRWTPAGLVGAGGAADIWLVSFDITFFVNAGGTALGASHKWDGTLDKVPDGSGTPTVISTASSIASGASAVWRHTGPHAIGALLNNGTTHVTIQFTETKTGTPGALHVGPILTYRLVG